MNKTTQYHIGSILVALSAFGQHLMGTAPVENVGTATGGSDPALTAEPTTDAPKKPRGRPAGSTNTPAPASSSAPAEPAPTPAADPVAASNTTASTGFTWEELKDIGRPLMTAAKGDELKAIIKKHMPKGGDPDKGLRELANYPEVHAAFKADVEAASY